MNPLLIAPVILPAMLAPLIVLALRGSLPQQRAVSMLGTLALWLIAVRLVLAADLGGVEVYLLGNWPAPFGIVLVLDRLSALMLLVTATLALLTGLYAIASGWDARGRHFHALFQFQLMGLNGAFLTGDVFNLFVFFEVLLIASYGLMVHSGGAPRLRAGVQYMVINLVGSTLFLFALGTLYAVTGTLNMADLAERVSVMPAGDVALLRVGAVLLLAVFAIKAALVPLHFWLPGTYAHAPAPVAALFAVMTKVGAYAILRIFTLIFSPDAAASAGIGGWVLPAALLTLGLGTAASLGATTLPRLAAFATVGSMGTLLIAIGQFTPQTTAAGLYYLVHSTFAAASLFLIADLIAARRGSLALVPGPAIASQGVIGTLFAVAAIGISGMPPLAGFVGKLLILDASRGAALVWLIWAVVLVTSLLSVLAFARAGSVLFWDTSAPAADQTAYPGLPIPIAAAPLALMLLLSVLAAPAMHYMERTAADLHAPAAYIDAVLGPVR